MELVTIDSFDSQINANLAKLKLDQAEIESLIFDLETVSMDWILGQAVGLIKLQVREEDASQAREVLKVANS